MISSLGNHFKTKREAHKVGRSRGDGFNPFSRTYGNTGSRTNASLRAGTWGGGDVEAQNRLDVADQNELAYTNTEPAYPSSYSRQSPDGADGANVPDARGSGSKDQETRDLERPAQEPARNGTGTILSENSMTGSATEQKNGTVRSRVPQKEAASLTNGKDEKKEKPKRDHRLFKNIQPKQPFTVANQIHRTILGSWINVLLLAAPAGIALGFVPGTNGVVLFIVNFIAIVPLAAMLSFATEEIALRTGETLGGLLNASFGYVMSTQDEDGPRCKWGKITCVHEGEPC